MRSNLTLLFFLQLYLTLKCIGEANKCGYNTCPKPTPGFLNVHVVAHTHDDLGWLFTVDEYFYGTGEDGDTSVKLILDSVVAALTKNSTRRFVYAETGFFWMWWQRQNKTSKRLVKELVNEGRLEFVGGGWAMHDEAVTHYQSLIDQMTLGFRHLDKAFGECGRPRVGWQIDPFGHSSESASLMARFGFDGLFFARMNSNEKNERAMSLSLEMIWEASANLGADADLFTSVLSMTYNSPDGFCFDRKCSYVYNHGKDISKEDHITDITALDFVDYLQGLAMSRRSNNILVPMGGDFHFQEAEEHIATLETLMNKVNRLEMNISVFFSTPSCYLKAVNDKQLQFPVKTKDFFPLIDQNYWTGYYTSRPALKYFERIGNNFLQICKQLFTLAQLDKKDIYKLDSLRESMAVLQHHDAVTGTEKQVVAFDYAAQLFKGLTNCAELTSSALSKLIIKATTSAKSELPLRPCWLLNISSCDVTETFNTFVITLYNPLSRMVSRHVRIPVRGEGFDYVVTDALGRRREVQIVPIPEHVLTVPGRFSRATVELVFLATGIPALGFKSYHVTTEIRETASPEENRYVSVSEQEEVLDTSMHVNGVKVEQDFLSYSSNSGAYTFKPIGHATVISSNPTSKYYKGPLLDEIHQVYNDWLTQVIRSYKGSNILEYNWMVGPIPEGELGQEIITRYTFADLEITNKTFYTDSNGREMIQRQEGHKYTNLFWNGIPGNYYPITTRVMIKDNKTQISVITDRSQGCSSLNNSQIEVMLHRRLNNDDFLGVGEVLSEKAFGTGLVVRGSHYLIAGEPNDQSAVDRLLVQEKVLGAWTFFTPTTMTFEQWKRFFNMKYSGLKAVLPPNVQILTLEPWNRDGYLIRLEHIMEKSDDPILSEPVTVDIKDIFVPFKITFIKETTLGGIQWRKDMKRMVWIKKGGNRTSDGSENFKAVNPSSVRLKAMEIRSFFVKLEF